MNRQKNLSRVEQEEFDVCIIGGGATGLGCAVDASLRGLKVILVEHNDFASGTSSKSTKLFHGGVRYLEQAFMKFDFSQLRLVTKALHERRILLNIAPHLAHPIALLTPCYSWWEGFYYAIGLKMYDFLAGKTNLAKSEWLDKAATLERMPQLKSEGLKSSVLYYDGQFDDVRFALALAKTANNNDAVLLNHVNVLDFEHDEAGKLCALNIRDAHRRDFYKVKAKVFVNATGVFADTIRQKATPSVSGRIKASKGAHLILPRESLPAETGILIPKTKDGRVIFMLPWQGRLLVGTTDDEATITTNDPILLKSEADYLIEYVNKYLEKQIEATEIRAGFAGFRPLVIKENAKRTKDLIRDHEVEYDAKSGLVSILGGKWTTYRLMAKDTIDKVERILKNGTTTPCTTDKTMLYGSENFEKNLVRSLSRQHEVPERITRYLVAKYGYEANKILNLTQKEKPLKYPLVEGKPIIKAQVIYAVVHEQAGSLKDIFANRLGLEHTDWRATYDALPLAAHLVAEFFDWTEEEEQDAIQDYRDELLRMRKESTGLGIFPPRTPRPQHPFRKNR